MIYTINNCIRAFGYTNFDKLITDMGSVDNLKAYVRANGYADIAVGEDTELLLVDADGKTYHTGCYGAKLNEYLCFTSTGESFVRTIGGRKTVYGTTYIQHNSLDYKINDGKWKTLKGNSSTLVSEDVILHDGDKMYVKAYWSTTAVPTKCYTRIYISGNVACSGNIMSLANFNTIPSEYQFYDLFQGSDITSAPDLPATTLTKGCYSKMFNGCSKLNYVKAMFTDISAQDCLTDWLSGVSTTGTFVKNSAATWTNEQAGIPSGWTVQTASPDK